MWLCSTYCATLSAPLFKVLHLPIQTCHKGCPKSSNSLLHFYRITTGLPSRQMHIQSYMLWESSAKTFFAQFQTLQQPLTRSPDFFSKSHLLCLHCPHFFCCLIALHPIPISLTQTHRHTISINSHLLSRACYIRAEPS